MSVITPETFMAFWIGCVVGGAIAFYVTIIGEERWGGEVKQRAKRTKNGRTSSVSKKERR